MGGVIRLCTCARLVRAAFCSVHVYSSLNFELSDHIHSAPALARG